MATGHSILDTLNAASKGGQTAGPSGKFRTKDLPISQLYRNAGNFYAIVEIEELAGMILTSGLLENLAVVYDPCEDGEYRIVSGERRWEALKLLVSRGYDEFAVATCNVRPKRSTEEETVDLIAANSQRVKSITDQLQEYVTLKQTLETMKANGQKLEGYDLDRGRLRDVIAAILHKSATKIGQIERITTHLIPELSAMLENGSLKFSAAYALAGMEENDQRAAYERAQEDTQEITYKEARTVRQTVESNPWASRDCEMVNGKCSHFAVIRANFMHRGNLEGCAGCCRHCLKRDTCDFCCGIVAADRPVEASPKTVTSMCYSCGNFTKCLDRTDKTINCDKWISKNAAPPSPAAPVETYKDQEREQPAPKPTYQEQVKRELEKSAENREDVLDMIRYCIENAGLTEEQLRRCLQVFDELRHFDAGDTVNVEDLLEAFNCIDEDGIVRDCTDPTEMYTPGEIMDVIAEVAERSNQA